MAQEIINIGAAPNDQQGDPLRTAFTKVNNNFTQLFAASSVDSIVYTTGAANTVLFSFDAASVASAEIRVSTVDQVSGETQSVTIDASTNAWGNSVKFTAHSTVFIDSELTNYEMDIVGNSVMLYSVPLSSNLLVHYVNSTLTIKSTPTVGLALSLDGYPPGNALVTESGVWLTTEAV